MLENIGNGVKYGATLVFFYLFDGILCHINIIMTVLTGQNTINRKSTKINMSDVRDAFGPVQRRCPWACSSRASNEIPTLQRYFILVAKVCSLIFVECDMKRSEIFLFLLIAAKG